MKDLSTVNGTYTNCLQAAMPSISRKFEDPEVDAAGLIEYTISCIAEARETKAKINFVNTLRKKRSKMDAMFYINNAWLCGSNLGLK